VSCRNREGKTTVSIRLEDSGLCCLLSTVFLFSSQRPASNFHLESSPAYLSRRHIPPKAMDHLTHTSRSILIVEDCGTTFSNCKDGYHGELLKLRSERLSLTGQGTGMRSRIGWRDVR
jgi:hypothetical protein